MKILKILCFSFIVITTLSKCSYYETTIIFPIENNDCDTIISNRVPVDIHPVEFLWHVDEDLIFDNYNQSIMPISHSFISPTTDGYYMRFEITDKEKFAFGEKFILLDNCDETWYNAHRIDDYHFELYLNNYCYDTMIDLHQRLFIVDIIFY